LQDLLKALKQTVQNQIDSIERFSVRKGDLIANFAVRAKGSDIEEGGDNIGHDGKTMMAKDHRNNHAAAKHELLMSC